MSFGRRLRLFFVGIVAIPMLVLAVLVLAVSRDSQDGKADARLAAGLDTTRAIYDEALRAAPDEADRIAREVGPDLADPDRAALTAVAGSERVGSEIVAVTILDADGNVLAASGPRDAIARGDSSVGSSDGLGRLGTVRVAMLDKDRFVARAQSLTGRDAVLADDTGVLASTAEVTAANLPETGAEDIELPGGDDGRGAALALDGASPGARLVLLTPVESGFVASEPLVAAVLVLFFALAFAVIVLLLRDLQRRIATMLDAARRIGEGDLDQKVPVEGDDEMAGLARELNRMSDRLREQMHQLTIQRRELDDSVRRIGEAFASGLDREALLEIVADTAVAACAAEAGRAALRDDERTIASKTAPEELTPVLRQAGEQVWDEGGEGVATDGERHSIAEAVAGRRGSGEVRCAIAVARHGKPFTAEERGVLRYLVGQTIASVENIDLHERVSQQALTDELTKIPNHRHFSQWLEQESDRVGRYGGELSLVLLDIDDFKRVNDTFGHLQGDRVLERIGALLSDQLREVDLAARYGGEEFVLALPGTPREGALRAAERLRSAVSGASIDGVEGTPAVSVTASLGVATMPADAGEPESLIAAADQALYEAKRSGKNVVVAAGLQRATAPKGNGQQRRS